MLLSLSLFDKWENEGMGRLGDLPEVIYLSTKCLRWNSEEAFWVESPWSGPLCHVSGCFTSASHHHCPICVSFGLGLFWCSSRRDFFQILGAVSERYCVIWFQVHSALIPCLYVFRQYEEGKTHSYSQGLGVLQNAQFGLTSSPFQGCCQCFDLCICSPFVSNIGKYTFENLYLNSCILKKKKNVC